MTSSLNRREFLGAVSKVSFATDAANYSPVLIVADEKCSPIVDAHVHCFAGTANARFPYHKDGPYHPEKASTPEDLLDCMTQAGVDFTVIVHPEPFQDDHRYHRPSWPTVAVRTPAVQSCRSCRSRLMAE